MTEPPAVDDEELAQALDEVVDALQAGHSINRSEVLARHPRLAEVLDAIADLIGPSRQPRPERIGPYRIDGELGAGGFGVVYLGYDPDVKRRVAIKVLHPGRLDQPEAIGRFQREAHATGRLHHSGIVQLFDYSRQGPPYYLVTEYVEGSEPRLWCRNQKAGPVEVADLMARIADAIDYAHRQGVLHRDLKPGNVLIDARGEPHILDFGLARLEAMEGVTLTAPTAEGHILGSLAYMPPEQAQGQSHTADARSDVYSLGVMLYELLAGRLPYVGPAHLLPSRVAEAEPPSPRCFNTRIPPDLEAVCLKAMARRPQDRYASAALLAADLRAFRAQRPVTARRLTFATQVIRFLQRRHLDTLNQGWTLLLNTLGVLILAGCTLCDLWERILPATQAWPAMLGTKLVQVTLMLVMVARLRPVYPLADQGQRLAAWTPAERQIWSLVPGYYGGFLFLVLMNWFCLDRPIPLAPVLALLSAMGFTTLGASIWGWFAAWGLGFFMLALVLAFMPTGGMTLLGLGWFLCLVLGGIHLSMTR